MIEFNRVYKLNIDITKLADALGINVSDVRRWDGRAWSQQLESRVNKQFNLTPSPSSGGSSYDHILPNGRKADSKLLTMGGVGIAPSMHVGDKGLSARILKEEGKEARAIHDAKLAKELKDHTDELVYIITDITDIQQGISDEVRVVFVEGKEAMTKVDKRGQIKNVEKAKAAFFK